MAKKLGKGLGRGLDAIFATENVEIVTDNDKIVEIALEEIKNKLEQGVISAAHARTLLSLKTKKAMEDVCTLVIERKMSVRELEEYVAKLLKPKEVKKAKAKDIFIEEQENILKKRLGTSVTIKQGRNKKGKIEIEFKDNDEFERIISLFKDE